MNKKSLILLPAMMMILASCGGNASDSTTDSSTSTSQTSSGTQTPSSSSSSSTSSDPEPESSLGKAYVAAEKLSSGEKTTEEYTFSGVVTAVTKYCFWMQDDGYGMYVFSTKATSGLAVGKVVEVTATLTNYAGLLETSSVSTITVKEDGTLPEAVKITSTEELAGIKQNILIDVTVGLPSETATWSSSAHGLNRDCTLGSDTVTVKFDKYAYTSDSGAIYDACKGKNITLTGALSAAYDYDGATDTNQIMVAGSTVLSAAE